MKQNTTNPSEHLYAILNIFNPKREKGEQLKLFQGSSKAIERRTRREEERKQPEQLREEQQQLKGGKKPFKKEKKNI